MKIKPKLLIRSKQLRKSQTPWENKLWYHLRNKNFKGFRFRRQFVISPYIVDFCCFEKKLIIEIDGGQHNYATAKMKDSFRTKYLQNAGFSIIRFWNNEIDENLEGVLEVIFNHLTPDPSPARRGGF